MSFNFVCTFTVTTCSTLLDWDENKCTIKINTSFRNVYIQRSCRKAFGCNSEFYESAKNYLLRQITGCVYSCKYIFFSFICHSCKTLLCPNFGQRFLLSESLLDQSEKRYMKKPGRCSNTRPQRSSGGKEKDL